MRADERLLAFVLFNPRVCGMKGFMTEIENGLSVILRISPDHASVLALLVKRIDFALIGEKAVSELELQMSWLSRASTLID